MKRLITLLFLFGIFLNSYTQKIDALPVGSSIASGDLFVFVQSGTTKQLQWVYIGNVLSDTADVLRAELPPLWRVDIADTADVLRLEIAAASTIDTAWFRSGDYVLLKFINDTVGVGTVTPTGAKMEVNGLIRATGIYLDDGQDNIKIGENAGAALGASDQNNLFVGKNSGAGATGDADANIGLGAFSLQSLTIGIDNIGLSLAGGWNLTTGSFNTLLNDRGTALTTGNYNLFGGYNAGNLCATSSTDNVFLGPFAGFDADINNGVGVGRDALYWLDSPAGVGVGFRAGKLATSSIGLTAIGGYAASTLTTSDFHTAVGFESLFSVQTSDGSSTYGYQCAKNAISAAGLSAYGYQCGLLIATGDDNSLFGSLTGSGIVGGSRNTLMGSVVGAGLVSGNDNTMIGRLAGNGSGDVTGCIYLGRSAGSQNTSNNVLSIDNTDDSGPAIWGDLVNDRIVIDGNATDNTNNRTFFSNGSAGGTTVWNNDSDRKLKKNIYKINNGLDIVKGLQGVRFEWKDGREPGERVGFIAQDVEKVLPEVVTAGDTYSMQTSQITAVLVEAIKTQQRQIESQQKQIDRLIKEVNKLK